MKQVIREWRSNDLPAVRHVMLTTWMDAYSPFIPVEDLRFYFEQHYNLPALEAFFATAGVSGFVAEIDGTVVGYVKNQFNADEKRFYVSSLYVLPAFQGRGLGTKLMNAAETRALTFGVDEVWLGVMTQNRAALEWYKGMGFHFIEEHPFIMGKTTVPHLIGYRKIGRTTPIERK